MEAQDRQEQVVLAAGDVCVVSKRLVNCAYTQPHVLSHLELAALHSVQEPFLNSMSSTDELDQGQLPPFDGTPIHAALKMREDVLGGG